MLNLVESVVIVVLLLVFFMGFKSGMIIGFNLVIIVLGSLLILNLTGGTLQRVSLGSFILAMGMLVDNAIVVLDGILIDLQRGKPRKEALTSIGKKTAMPLLGATLIAILAFSLSIFLLIRLVIMLETFYCVGCFSFIELGVGTCLCANSG